MFMVTFSKYQDTCVDKEGTNQKDFQSTHFSCRSIHLVTLSENVVLEILKLEVY